MPTVNMVWKEEEFQLAHNNGQDEGFVFEVLGPSYIYPAHREPVLYSPHGCKNAGDSTELIIPAIAAITFERSAARSHGFSFPEDQERPLVKCFLTSSADPFGRFYQLAAGEYDPPADSRRDETYSKEQGANMARLDFEMNEVKAMYLNVSFELKPNVPFFFGGTFHLWVSYWGFANYCSLHLKGAPDHAGLVDMKYTRPPRC